MFWLWCVRLCVLGLGWHAGLLIYGFIPPAEPMPEWLVLCTVVATIAAVAVWRPIVFDHRARKLWRARPGWWPWSVLGAVLPAVIVVAASAFGLAPADTGGERGIAAVSIFVLGLSLPVYLACHRAAHGGRPSGPVPLPRSARRARERAARRGGTSGAARR
ncbi:hypothetical protein ACFQY4_36960 [Catellatospora bangladeshensis]|uniref:Uncharacterized protein n=1 Tax=Catellatospora bangladeshensis TaxID=310355 RepID=A0A8J3NJU2_9ACTN|nr:hypothetical protein [Catellatospora bangladeshensis]GIF83412.1 hypothetical protein Cba03nite_47610 [Catellatospora bangladeshensis]